MAKAKKSKEQKKAQKEQSKSLKQKKRFPMQLMLLVVALPLAFFQQMAFVMTLLGLVPSIIAHIIDRDKKKMAFYTIFLMNLTGLMPFIAFIWGKSWDNAAVYAVMKDPTSWMMMWGAAFLGWLMVYLAPQAAVSAFHSSCRSRKYKLETAQKNLVYEWGEEVKMVDG